MPKIPGVVVVADDVALAQVIAEHVVGCARDAVAARGRFNLALAGGSTPKSAYALLASPALRHAVRWQDARFFFGDERCVPPDDEQSNYKMAMTALLRPLAIDAATIFRMHGEDVPATAARNYADLLTRELPAADGAPRFDLILLGLGPDGHTASLFPGTNPLEDDAALVKAPYVKELQASRLTLTPRVLNNAREIAVATSGKAKTVAVSAVLQGARDPTTYPAQILGPRSGQITWFLDRVAAADLR